MAISQCRFRLICARAALISARCVLKTSDEEAHLGLRHRPVTRSNPVLLGVALLVTSLVRFLVFVFLEVPLLGVVQVVRLVILAFAHALLVPRVLRIIRLLLVLEKWSA